MLYLKKFSLPQRWDEEGYFAGGSPKTRRTCYTTKYPFGVFRYRELPVFEFEPVTVFYGGNGSGKSTILNVIAEKLQIRRNAPGNRSDFFEDYVGLCAYQPAYGAKIPENSRMISSDDVFDYLLDIRRVNAGIDARRAQLIESYASDRYTPYQLASLDDYEEWRRRADAKSASQSEYIRRQLKENIPGQSNGESAMAFFARAIEDGGLYLLDEPENSLSAARQLELGALIENAARFFRCQFVIATHAPFLLALRGARIYDLDAQPPCVRKWTELENVRIYRDFFRRREAEFGD